jgi:hypothetical protein
MKLGKSVLELFKLASRELELKLELLRLFAAIKLVAELDII